MTFLRYEEAVDLGLTECDILREMLSETFTGKAAAPEFGKVIDALDKLQAALADFRTYASTHADPH